MVEEEIILLPLPHFTHITPFVHGSSFHPKYIHTTGP